MGCPTLGFAATDFLVLRLGHRAVVGQGDHIDGDESPAFARAVGDQPCQEGIDLAFECLEVVELIGQGASHWGARRGVFKLVACGMDREVSGGGKHQHSPQVATWDGAWHVQGQGMYLSICFFIVLSWPFVGAEQGKMKLLLLKYISRVLMVNLSTSWLFKVY